MKRRKPSPIRPSEITERGVWERRRQFIKAAAAAGAASLLPLGSRLQAGEKIPGVIKSALSSDADPTPYDDVTGYNNFYEFGTDKRDPAESAHRLETRPWNLSVDGECEAPGEIGIEDILKLLPQEERVYRLRCVEAWAMVIPWVGFPLGDLLKRFKPTSAAKYVAFTTLYDVEQMPGQRLRILDWPYREGLRMDEAMHPLTILATGLYGELLPNQNGAPLRLVVPWKYGFKSIKSIVSIRFEREQPTTSWNALSAREYGFYANVNPAVEHPRWSQKYHRNIGEDLFAGKQPTEPFNGYGEQVAQLYAGMDLSEFY